ncbi:hypothetical protein [Paenibacillus piri]|uniref:Bacterial Pleckstrin homology domain-containing protein n=1 Tax=Paenibacillus piri TaxID=2547395 RepID=A0A4R5KIX5_9BACL|nr:hypothetical protein [Paenibacillus piri]TDF94728.1 hypothetical protein E1757_22485 [Paenibacillus piri]
MGVQVNLGNSEIVFNISGWTALTSLRREIKIPYTSIENVQAGHFEFPWKAVKRAGINFPNGYKAGEFLYNGQKYFLSFRDGNHVVILDLKGCEFDKVVIQSEAPKQLADHIMEHCPG